MSIHAFFSCGLNSLRWRNSFSSGVRLLPPLRAGFFLMEWSVTAFCIFSMQVSKLPLPNSAFLALPTMKRGRRSI